LQISKAIGGRTSTIERAREVQGWTVFGIPSTRSGISSPVPPLTGSPGQAPLAAGHLAGICRPGARRHGLERELITCHGRVPGSVHRAGAQAGVACRRRRDLNRELPRQCRPRAPPTFPHLALHMPTVARSPSSQDRMKTPLINPCSSATSIMQLYTPLRP